ncbi:MAG: hypothetical protein L3K19_06240 [Thermoplasmata archaeon]|nr:hypothetical protein [Thermoplasmata archaeon]
MSGGALERRRIGRGDRTISVIGLDLSEDSSGPRGASIQGAGTLQRAFAAGIDAVDLCGRGTEGAEGRVGASRPPEGSDLSALVLVDEGRPAPPATSQELLDRLRSGLDQSAARIGVPVTLFPCLLPSQGAWLDRPETPRLLQELADSGATGGWGLKVTPATRLDLLPPVLEAGAGFLVMAANLLDHRLAVEAERVVRGGRASLLVEDPFAHGALDGGFLRGSSVSDGPSARFERWETLEQRLRPVTRLGFLTEERTRTLAEAAIQFVLGLPSVASVLVRPVEPTTVEAALSALGRPPLSAATRHRVNRSIEEPNSPSE